MAPLEKAAAVAAIVLPLLVGAWWAGSGYVEFNDRLSALERELIHLHELRDRYEREQTKNALVNEQVDDLEKHVDWLRWHHHEIPGGGGDTGRGHVD